MLDLRPVGYVIGLLAAIFGATMLFPLFAEIESLPGIGTKTGKLLRNLEISAPKDLLLTLPYAGIDRRLRHSVATAEVPATVTVEITVGPHRPPATKALKDRSLMRKILVAPAPTRDTRRIGVA